MSSVHPSDFGLNVNCPLKPTENFQQYRCKISDEGNKPLMYQEKHKTATVLPQLRNDPSYFIPVVDVIELFFKAENLLWSRIVNSPFPINSQSFDSHSYSSVSSGIVAGYRRESNQVTDTNVHKLIGEAFLGHGKSSQEIHEFFVKLDPRRCCVNCREVSGKVAGPLRRVTHNNTRASNRAPTPQGNLQKPTPQFFKLSENEESIYIHALHCASRPFLSCPDEPSPSPHSRIRSMKHSSNSSVVDVNIEQSMLFTTLARSFEISSTLHNKLREDLRRNRSYNKVLEDDLTDQLYRLEANECYFYRYDSFANRDYYEEWRETELGRLKKMINKWCPDFKNIKAFKLNPFDAHSAFTILVDKFLRFNLREKIENAANESKNTTFTSIMTTTSKRLLEEFGLRYGVCLLFREISILDGMIKHLDYTDWYLICLKKILLKTMKDVEDNYRFLVKKEKYIIEESIKTLHRRIEYGFVKIYALYPKNISENGVSLLLDLLEKVIQTKVYFRFWDKEEEPNVNEMLQQYVKLAVLTNYKDIKTKADLECFKDGNTYDTQPTADALRHILQSVKKSLQIFKELCDRCPILEKRCGDVVTVVARTLYKEFMKDVNELCIRNTESIQVSAVDYAMMGLAFRLHKLDQDWIEYIAPSEQKWRINYKVVLYVVIRAITEYVYEQIPNYIINDKLQVLDLSEKLPAISMPTVAPFRLSPAQHQVRHSHSSPFTSVQTIREKLQRGSVISIEGNLNTNSTNSKQNSFESDIDEEISQDATSNNSNVHHDSTDDEQNSNLDSSPVEDETIEENDFHDRERLSSLDHANDDTPVEDNCSIVESNGKTVLENNKEIECLVKLVINDLVETVITVCEKSQQEVDTMEEIIVSNLLHTIVEEVSSCLDEKRNDLEDLKKKSSDESVVHKSMLSEQLNNVNHNGITDIPSNGVIDCEDECDDLESEVQFSENPNNVGVVRKRPSSQPIPYEGTSIKKEADSRASSLASRYSIDGPITDNARGNSYDSIDSYLPTSSKSNPVKKFRQKDVYEGFFNNFSGSTSYKAHTFYKQMPQKKHNKSSKVNHVGVSHDPDDDLIHLPSNGLIMTTSSLTDVLTACARLISFSKTVCSLILPSADTKVSVDLSGNKDLHKHYDDIRKDIFNKVVTSVKDVLKMYVSTLVSLDVCGSKTFNRKIDPNVLREVKENRSEGIPGCRHCLTMRNEPDDEEPCVILNRLIYGSLGGWELVTKEMCFRINDVHSLIKILPCIQKKAAESLNVNLELLLQKHNTEKEQNASYCTYGPSDTPVWYPSFQQLCFDLKAAEEFMNKILHLQVKLLTFRAMDIFKKLFDALFPLPLNERTIEEHMSTCMSHLESQMKFFHHSLYPDCVTMVTLEVWKVILEKFHALVDELHDTKDDPREKGRNLPRLLMIIMNKVMAGQKLHSQFHKEMRTLTFRLALFHMPLERLRSIYDELESYRIHEMLRNTKMPLTFEEIVYVINTALKKLGRPSFSGKAFISVLTTNEAWLDRLTALFGFDAELSSSARLKLIARRFLQRNIIKQIGEARRVCQQRVQPGVVMSPHPSDPEATFEAPVRLHGLTIDVLAQRKESARQRNRSEERVSTLGSTTSSSDPDRTPVQSQQAITEEFIESEYVYYTFETHSSGSPNIEIIGKLHAIVRAEGQWIVEAVREDIIGIHRAFFCSAIPHLREQRTGGLRTKLASVN